MYELLNQTSPSSVFNAASIIAEVPRDLGHIDVTEDTVSEVDLSELEFKAYCLI